MLFFHFDSNSRVCINEGMEKETTNECRGKNAIQIEPLKAVCALAVFTVQMDTWLSCHIWKNFTSHHLHVKQTLSSLSLALYSPITPKRNWHIDICNIHATSLIIRKCYSLKCCWNKKKTTQLKQRKSKNPYSARASNVIVTDRLQLPYGGKNMSLLHCLSSHITYVPLSVSLHNTRKS